MKAKIVMIMSQLALIALSVFGVFALFKFSTQKTNKFGLAEITSSRPFEPLFETRPLTHEEMGEVNLAIDQPYTYFGCGGQSFVFFSNDGKYVLKFFKQRHFNLPTHLNAIPFIGKYREKKYGKRLRKLQLDYGSYKIGFEKLFQETGLIYIHLNKTDHLKKVVRVKDASGTEHAIDLDQTDFILQRRADLVLHRIDSQMRERDIKGAKETIAQVVDLIVTRCKKGYADRDPNIATNCGILGNRAIKIDVGRFVPNAAMEKPLYFKPELYRITRPFRTWLKHHHPELVSALDEELLKVIAHE